MPWAAKGPISRPESHAFEGGRGEKMMKNVQNATAFNNVWIPPSSVRMGKEANDHSRTFSYEPLMTDIQKCLAVIALGVMVTH